MPPGPSWIEFGTFICHKLVWGTHVQTSRECLKHLEKLIRNLESARRIFRTTEKDYLIAFLFIEQTRGQRGTRNTEVTHPDLPECATLMEYVRKMVRTICKTCETDRTCNTTETNDSAESVSPIKPQDHPWQIPMIPEKLLEHLKSSTFHLDSLRNTQGTCLRHNNIPWHSRMLLATF